MDFSRVEWHWLWWELCTNMGFCLHEDACERLQAGRYKDALELADAIMVAEGLDPTWPSHRGMRRGLANAVQEHWERAERAQ